MKAATTLWPSLIYDVCIMFVEPLWHVVVYRVHARKMVCLLIFTFSMQKPAWSNINWQKQVKYIYILVNVRMFFFWLFQTRNFPSIYLQLLVVAADFRFPACDREHIEDRRWNLAKTMAFYPTRFMVKFWPLVFTRLFFMAD